MRLSLGVVLRKMDLRSAGTNLIVRLSRQKISAGTHRLK